MERKQNSVESNRLMDGNIYVLNVATPIQRQEPARGSGRGTRPLDPPPPIPPPPTSIPPPPPPPKDYPSAPPVVGKPPTSQTVNRLKSKFEQRHWVLSVLRSVREWRHTYFYTPTRHKSLVSFVVEPLVKKRNDYKNIIWKNLWYQECQLLVLLYNSIINKTKLIL